MKTYGRELFFESDLIWAILTTSIPFKMETEINRKINLQHIELIS